MGGGFGLLFDEAGLLSWFMFGLGFWWVGVFAFHFDEFEYYMMFGLFVVVWVVGAVLFVGWWLC